MANVSVVDVETGVYFGTGPTAVPAIAVPTVGWTAGGSGAQAGTNQDNTKGKGHTHE